MIDDVVAFRKFIQDTWFLCRTNYYTQGSTPVDTTATETERHVPGTAAFFFEIENN